MKQIHGINYREGTSDEQVLHEVIHQDCYFFNQWKPKTQPKCIIDVGCQIGVFSSVAASRFKDCKVLSFEIDSENFKIAESNLSKFENCKVYNSAVCGKNSVLGYRKNHNNTGGNKAVFKGSDSYISEDKLEKTTFKGIESPVEEIFPTPNSINLEQVLNDNKIDEVDFLKMDCEGSEHEIIPHLVESGLFKKIKNLSLELHGRDKKEYNYIVSSLIKNFNTAISLRNGVYMHCRD